MVDRLLNDGHEVVVLDNYSTGRPENLSHVMHHEKLQCHEVDICDDISEYFKDVDWVFHLASLADIVPSIQNPMDYHRSNVDGTVSVLQAATKAQVKKLVYAASSSCYGIPDNYPTAETADIRPQYPYALTKNVAEQYVIHWNQVYKLPCVSLRLFNVYGPRSRTSGTYGAVFGVFLAQKLANKPYTIVGDGKQSRDFTFVTDVVNAFVMSAESALDGEIMNVGSDDTFSINRLVELLGGDVIHIPKRPGEPDCTYADITQIKQKLKWQISISFEDGVGIMLDNIDYWKQAVVWNESSIGDATKDWFKYLGD